MQSYKDLIVWQKSYQLCLDIYSASKLFPKEELFGITSQIRRASLSIPSNIAEGSTRGSKKEYVQFLRIAFASGAEVETQLMLCKDLGLIKEKDYITISSLLTEVMKMLNTLIQKLSTT
jgi:four helix bundle protein